MPASMDRQEGIRASAAWVQGTVCKILDEEEVKPHKVRYYLERVHRFPPRMPKWPSKGNLSLLKISVENLPIAASNKTSNISSNNLDQERCKLFVYHEKFWGSTLFTRSMVLGTGCKTTDYDHPVGLGGIDLLSGQVHALVRDRHRSCAATRSLRKRWRKCWASIAR
jgi:hypothetical protein